MSDKSACEISTFGTKRWYNSKRELHRENDLPAIEWAHMEGFEWWLNGKRHRESGPAIEDSNGYKAWYVDGERVDCKTQEEFLRMMKLRAFW